MKELASNDLVTSLTIEELEALILRIVERQQLKPSATGDGDQVTAQAVRTESQIRAIRALRGSGRGERLLERLWEARAEERSRER